MPRIYACLFIFFAQLVSNTASAEQGAYKISDAHSEVFQSLPDDIGGVWNALPKAVSPSGPAPRYIGGKFYKLDADDREIVNIDHNFKVLRGETVEFDSKIIIMSASNRLKKEMNIYGNLIIRNSILIWEQEYNQQVELVVKNGGSLRIVNSYADASGAGWWNWTYETGSKIYYERFHSAVWTTAAGSNIQYEANDFSWTRLTFLEGVNNSSFLINDALVLDLEIFTPKRSKISASVPPEGAVVDWELHNFYKNTTLDVNSSRATRIDLTLTEGTDLTLSDYDGGNIGLIIDRTNKRRETCIIEGFGDPLAPEVGIRVEEKSWNFECIRSKLTLVNSRAVGIWPTIWGNVDLVVENSRLIDPGNLGCGANFIIRDSLVDLFRTRTGCDEGARSYIANSTVNQAVESSGSNVKVWLYNTKILGHYTPYKTLETDGAKIIEVYQDKVPWR